MDNSPLDHRDILIGFGIDPKVLKIINPPWYLRLFRIVNRFKNHWFYKLGLRRY